MAKATGNKVGLFHVCYNIGGDKPGAPLFKVSLAVFTPHKTVSGLGHISQATRPPLDIATKLQGEYTYMCVMPKVCHILVTATGYPVIHWPHSGGVGPVIPHNVELRMVLSEDWKSGTANYKYIDSKGVWHEVTDAPVAFVECNSMIGG